MLTKGVQYSLVFIKGSSSRARLCGFSILYEKDEKPYSRLAAWEMNHLIKIAKPAWRLMELHLIRQLRCHLGMIQQERQNNIINILG
ncbi:hypothetical protein, partial [Dialister hominis]|uniref:hypothetical protein n=1 Tax=Dialister hominis TaxID=2582419 RepID=UPI003FD7F37A